ncbi:MAG TPA: hypothetical protein VL996_02000 [Methylocella sp.]|nr:hypothetical protein [Methylocella sp.]
MPLLCTQIKEAFLPDCFAGLTKPLLGGFPSELMQFAYHGPGGIERSL